MSSVEAHYLLNSLYNLEFRLFDHMDPLKKATEPFAVIRAFPEENPQAYSLLEDIVVRYSSNKIFQRYHITLLDYLKLPTPLARNLDDIAERIVSGIEREDAERHNRALQKSMGSVDGK